MSLEVGKKTMLYTPIVFQLMYGGFIWEVYGGRRSIVEKCRGGKEKYSKTLYAL